MLGQEQWIKHWMDELLNSDTGYVQHPRSNYVTSLTNLLILEISIHVQDYGKKDLEYGSHSRIKEIFSPPEVVGVLETEFKTQRGKILVSRKSYPSTFDQLTNYIKFVRIIS